MRRMRRDAEPTASLLILLAILAATAAPAAAAEWDGEGDNQSWSDPLNWRDDVVPMFGNVIIGDSDVTVLADVGGVDLGDFSCAGSLVISGIGFRVGGFATVDKDLLINDADAVFDSPDEDFGLVVGGNFVLSNSHLRGRSTVTVKGPAIWAGSTITTERVVFFAGDLQITNGPNQAWLNSLRVGVELHTYGTTTVNHAFSGEGLNEWHNFGTAIVESANDFWAMIVINEPEGTLRLEGDCIFFALESHGAIEVTGEAPWLRGHERNEITGDVSVGPNSRFAVRKCRFADTASITGGGTLVCGPASGAIDFDTADLTIAEIEVRQTFPLHAARFNVDTTLENLTLLHNGVQAGPGLVTVTGSLLMHGGMMGGSGTTFVAENGALTIIADEEHLLQPALLDTRALVNHGAATLSGNGTMTGGREARFLNSTSGHLTVTNSPRVQWIKFWNDGDMDVAVGTFDIGMEFSNDGHVLVDQGLVLARGGGEHGGTFDIDGNATLRFGGTPVFTVDAVLTGPGLLHFSGGEAIVEGDVTVDDVLVSGGRARFESDVTFPRLELTGGGRLEGAGTVTVGGLTWSGGTMNGDGETVVELDLVLESDTSLHLGRTLRSESAGVWTGAGALARDGGNLFVNAGGATFDIRNDAECWWDVQNLGTVRKVSADGPTSFRQPLTNEGFLHALAGRLNFYNTFRQERGETKVAGGGSIGAPETNTLHFDGGTLTGSGVVSAPVDGDLLLIDPGTPQEAGTLQIVWDYASTADTTVTITLGDPHDRVVIDGDATLDGTLNLSLLEGYVPEPGAVFRVLETRAARTGAFAAVSPPSDLPDGLGVEVSYEDASVVVTIVEQDGCTEDINGSGDVGFEDVIAILAAWGPCEDCPEDLDDDGLVDFNDLISVLSAWGPCA